MFDVGGLAGEIHLFGDFKHDRVAVSPKLKVLVLHKEKRVPVVCATCIGQSFFFLSLFGLY